MLKLIKRNPAALIYGNDKLLQNYEFILMDLRVNKEAIEYIPNMVGNKRFLTPVKRFGSWIQK